MMFENILKKFAADLIPRLLPDILRSIADQIESGGVAQITPDQVHVMLDSHQDAIRAVAAEVGQ